jgi:hypothetical protein
VTVSFVVACAQWGENVLEADLIGDEEECAITGKARGQRNQG